MAQQTIGVGSAVNDGTGDPLRTAFGKVNANFTELYGATLSAAVAADVRTGTDTAKYVTSSALAGSAAYQTLTDGATISWAMGSGFNAKVTLGGNRTLATPSGMIEGMTYVLQVIQDATGSRTMTWPASTIFDWGSAGTPTLSTAAGKIDLIFLQCINATTPLFRASFNKAS